MHGWRRRSGACPLDVEGSARRGDGMGRARSGSPRMYITKALVRGESCASHAEDKNGGMKIALCLQAALGPLAKQHQCIACLRRLPVASTCHWHTWALRLASAVCGSCTAPSGRPDRSLLRMRWLSAIRRPAHAAPRRVSSRARCGRHESIDPSRAAATRERARFGGAVMDT